MEKTDLKTQNPPSDVVPSGGESVAVSAHSGAAATTSGVSSGQCVAERKGEVAKPRALRPRAQGSASGKGKSLTDSDSTSAMESAEDIVVEVSSFLDPPKIELVRRPSGSKFFRAVSAMLFF